MYRARKRRQPNLPHSLDDLEIPDHLRATKNGARFLLHDTGPGNERVVLYATEESLQILSRVDKVWLDGTFKSAPDIFFQVNILKKLLMYLQFEIYNHIQNYKNNSIFE